MNIDDVLARHRPAEVLGPDARTHLWARLAEHDDPDADRAGELVPLVVGPGPTPRPRRTWLPAAAAAAVLLCCAAGAAVWRASDRPEPAATGDAAPICRAELPASWNDARADAPLQVDGHNAVPVATSTDGKHQVLSWSESPTTVTLGLRGTDGVLRPVGSYAAQDAPDVVGTDGRRVVLGFRPATDASVTDLVLVDTGTRTSVHLLRSAPMPDDWQVDDVAVADGKVYWGASPSISVGRGIVIRYTAAEDDYRVVARLDGFPTLVSDVRGVSWPGGSAPRTGLPATLPAQLDASGGPADRLVTDGSSYGWQVIAGDQTVFHWADGSGDTRTFRVPIDAEHDGAMLTAVSGPYLFFHVNKAHGTDSVLDTRTGALATNDRDYEVISMPGKHLYEVAGGFEYHRIDAGALPGFGCR